MAAAAAERGGAVEASSTSFVNTSEPCEASICLKSPAHDEEDDGAEAAGVASFWGCGGVENVGVS